MVDAATSCQPWLQKALRSESGNAPLAPPSCSLWSNHPEQQRFARALGCFASPRFARARHSAAGNQRKAQAKRRREHSAAEEAKLPRCIGSADCIGSFEGFRNPLE
jgi:hypothetical protein